MKTWKEFLAEMSRPRSKAVKFVDGIQDTVQEHIFKIYAYGKSNPNDITGWHISLSKHVKKFRLMNVGSKKPNLSRDYMINALVYELFEYNDVKQLSNIYYEDYGQGRLSNVVELDVSNLQIIAVRYVDFLLDSGAKTYRVNNTNIFNVK